MAKINLGAFARLLVSDLARWTTRCVNNVAVNTGKANGVNSAITKRRKNVSVDLAGKNHLRHLQCVIVSYPSAFDDRLLDA